MAEAFSIAPVMRLDFAVVAANTSGNDRKPDGMTAEAIA